MLNWPKKTDAWIVFNVELTCPIFFCLSWYGMTSKYDDSLHLQDDCLQTNVTNQNTNIKLKEIWNKNIDIDLAGPAKTMMHCIFKMIACKQDRKKLYELSFLNQTQIWNTNSIWILGTHYIVVHSAELCFDSSHKSNISCLFFYLI